MNKDQMIAQAFELIRKRGFKGISTDKLRSLVAEGEKVLKVHPRTGELVEAFRREVARRDARKDELAAAECQLVATNNNGSNDHALYQLRKELDTLRRLEDNA